MPNAASKEAPNYFAVSIDSVETITGIDFFPLLPDDQEILLEKSLCIDCWNWSFQKKEITVKEEPITIKTESTKPVEKATAVQCSGKTKAKKRCKRMTKSANGKCSQHGGV